MATTLYHAAPSSARASILEHGLDIRYGRRCFLPDDVCPDEELRARQAGRPLASETLLECERHYPLGIYLIDSAAKAQAHGTWHFEESDVWRVDMSGLHLALDRDHDGRPSSKNEHGGQAFFSYDAVPVERLELVGGGLPNRFRELWQD